MQTDGDDRVLRFSLFFWLWLTGISAVLIVEFLMPPKLALRETSSALDIAVLGDGYFSVHNPETIQTDFTRSGKLRIADDQRVVLHVDGQDWELQPSMGVSEAATDLRVDRNGKVFEKCEATWELVGSIVLYRFDNQANLPNPLGINHVDMEPGRAVSAYPGTSGVGILAQGWIEERRLISWHRVLGVILIGLMIWRKFASARRRPTSTRCESPIGGD